MAFIASALMALTALTALIVARAWMLKKVKESGEEGERPFDYEDEPMNPYTGKTDSDH